MRFDRLAERQILKAQAEGQLDNLKGAGRPLPPMGDGDAAEAAGFRIMAEAGALPLEIELRKTIEAHIQVLRSTTDPNERKRLMSDLAGLHLKLAIQEETRRKFYSTR